MAITSLSGVTPYLPTRLANNDTATLSQNLLAALINSNISVNGNNAIQNTASLMNELVQINPVVSTLEVEPNQAEIQDELFNTYYTMLKDNHTANDFSNEEFDNSYLNGINNFGASINMVASQNNYSMFDDSYLPLITNKKSLNALQKENPYLASTLINNTLAKIDLYI